jgi:hypothetical protein
MGPSVLVQDLLGTLGKRELPKGLWGNLRFAWLLASEMGDFLGDRWHFRVASMLRWPVRLGIFLWALVVLPWVWLAMRKPRRDAVGRLQARVEDLWQTNPYEALQLLRSVSDELNRRNLGWKNGSGRPVQIEPFGRFTDTDAMELRFYLLEYEISFSHYEEALALCQEMPDLAPAILMQVTCLEKMGRQHDAIALLQQKLSKDNWRGDLRAKLTSLVGHPGAGLN